MHKKKLVGKLEKIGMNLALIPDREKAHSLPSLNNLETGKFRWSKIPEKY